MENADAKKKGGSAYIYGNAEEAPYINNELMPRYAHAANFRDILSLSTPSEPHYVLMEAGTNVFDDFTFGDTDDGNDDPSRVRSTSSTAHLTSQMRATDGRVTWMSYQEGLSEETGACPIQSSEASGYAAKHNPFVFFKDVSGDPPSKTSEYCAAHHRPYSALSADMAAGRLANYVFVSPSLCNDMHDECGEDSRVKAGDSWLAAELPSIITWAEAHDGVIFLAWDEGDETRKIPFMAIGKQVKKGYAAKAKYDHRSIVKTVGKIFGLPELETVKGSRDLGELFEDGVMP
jgi:phospholipase C